MKHIFSVLLAVGAAMGSSASAQEIVTDIALEKRVVVLSDIAILPEPVAFRYGSRPIAKFPRHIDALELSEERRRQLLRHQLPALTVPLRHRGTVLFHSSVPTYEAVSRLCFVLQRSIEAGAFLYKDNIEQIGCRDDEPTPPLRFVTEAGVLAATQPMEAGFYLGAIRVPAQRAVAADTEMRLVSRQGPVSITRHVTTLQAAPAGSRIFVRTDDGDILSAPLSQGEKR